MFTHRITLDYCKKCIFYCCPPRHLNAKRSKSKKESATARTERAIKALATKQKLGKLGDDVNEESTGSSENVQGIDLENPDVREAIAQIVEEDEFIISADGGHGGTNHESGGGGGSSHTDFDPY